MATNSDVLIVGAGCAGLTAAIGLAQAGFRVVLLEAAEFPGAANTSGGVYFGESLAHPDILGPEKMHSLAWERRLVERGSFVTDGRRLLGVEYRDAVAFSSCFTVLRSTFDRNLGELAVRAGASLLGGTTVESLIRAEGRVIGVCTNRGPRYADLIFLAEGDASQLVAREGYERSNDLREAPRFSLGIHRVIHQSAATLERLFRLAGTEGLAYEVRVRNPVIRGRAVRLNMTGSISTNRESLSVSLLVPADHLVAHFDGDAGSLMDWFLGLPALAAWLGEGGRGPWGARLLRSGGARDIPRLIDHGLAVGGAACTLGTDFPYLNYTGPATATGLLLVQAARRIRKEGGRYTSEDLERNYLQPLRKTRFWKDAEFLRHWPDYTRRTHTLFGRGTDLILGTAEIWTGPRWLPAKWFAWIRLLCWLGGPAAWPELRVEWRRLRRALHLADVAGQPALGRALLDGSLNALRDLTRRPRANLSPGGALRFTSRAGDSDAPGPPRFLRRWFRRFAPVLASAARQVLANDEHTLAEKLPAGVRTLIRQVNLLDLLAAAGVGFAAGLQGVLFLALARLGKLAGRRSEPALPAPEFTEPAGKPDLPPLPDAAPRKTPFLRVVRSQYLPGRSAEEAYPLHRLCPAHVFEIIAPLELRVFAERCVRCEACWRTTSLVDWCWVEPADSPPRFEPLPGSPQAEPPDREPSSQVTRLLEQLEQKLLEFDTALASTPETITPNDAEYLEMLARYAQQLGGAIMENAARLPASWTSLASQMQARLEERSRRTWDRRFAWAAADGRQVRWHHLAGLRRLMPDQVVRSSDAVCVGLRVEESTAAIRPEEQARAAARRYVTETIEHLLRSPEGLAASPSLIARLTLLMKECQGAEVGPALRAMSAASWPDESLRTALGQEGHFATLRQRRALLSELEQVEDLESRLARLAAAWQTEPQDETTSAELRESLADPDTRLLVARAMLLRTHARLEEGIASACEIQYLRMWIEEITDRVTRCAAFLRHEVELTAWREDRPLGDPEPGPPPATHAAYRAATAPYTSGDFLVLPVDLGQPRLVPEMLEAGQDPLAALSGRLALSGEWAADALSLDVEPQSAGQVRRRFAARFLAATVACEYLGRTEHPQTHSLELETATTPLLLCLLARRLSGRECDPKRDEETVRGELLERLCRETIPRWSGQAEPVPPRHLGHEALETEALRMGLRQRIEAAVAVCGAALGSDPNLGPARTLLAEAVAWFKGLDSVLYRLAWLGQRALPEDAAEPGELLQARRALLQCQGEVRLRLQRIDEALARLRRGLLAPEVWAGILLARGR